MSGLMGEDQLATYRRIANDWRDFDGDAARLRDCLKKCVDHIDAQEAEIERLELKLFAIPSQADTDARFARRDTEIAELRAECRELEAELDQLTATLNMKCRQLEEYILAREGK